MLYSNAVVVAQGISRRRLILPMLLNHQTTTAAAAAATTTASSFAIFVGTQQQQQRRPITSFLRNMFRTGSLTSLFVNDDDDNNNPLVEALKQQQQQQQQSANTETDDTTVDDDVMQGGGGGKRRKTIVLPQFSRAQPHHVKAAAEYVQERQRVLTAQLCEDMEEEEEEETYSISNIPATAAGEAAAVDHNQQQQQQQLAHHLMIRRIDAVEQPAFALRQMTSLLWLLSSDNDENDDNDNDNKRNSRSEWRQAAALVSSNKNATLNLLLDDEKKLHQLLLLLVLGQKSFAGSGISNNDAPAPHSPPLLHAISDDDANDANANDATIRFAAHSLMRQYEAQTGRRVLFDDSSSNNNNNRTMAPSSTSYYQELSEALTDVEQRLLAITQSSTSTSTSTSTPQKTVSLLYNYIGICTEQAKLLGYGSVTERVFFPSAAASPHSSSSLASFASANVAEIRHLHATMAERLAPYLKKLSGGKKSKDALELDAYLGGSGGSTGPTTTTKNNTATMATTASSGIISDMMSPERQRRRDAFGMLQLERHVTLDGALQFAFHLTKDLFGVSFERADADDETTTCWRSDVRLYHAYDEMPSGSARGTAKVYLGSFYLDPFQREGGKLARTCTIPIFARHGTSSSQLQLPLVAMSLELNVPAWDTDPAVVTWHDCESLLHELGHVLQFLLARPAAGCLVGPQNMPLDISEFLPKFMELWLTEKSTLYALIDLSNSETPLSDEAIDAAYRVRSHEKVMKLAQQTFYGALELELFSGFDLKGSETIMALQRRLALELIPHDVPDEKDLTPLLDILQENANGRHVAWYRYIWCEVLSATFFERFKEAHATNPDSIPQLRQDLRRLLLEPGAAIDVKAFRSKFGLVECSPEALWKLNGL